MDPLPRMSQLGKLLSLTVVGQTTTAGYHLFHSLPMQKSDIIIDSWNQTKQQHYLGRDFIFLPGKEESHLKQKPGLSYVETGSVPEIDYFELRSEDESRDL